MKARHAYPLLFLVPGVMLAAISAALAVASAAGVLWLFVYGDDPWPAAAGALLTGIAALFGVGVFAGVLLLAYRTGRRREHAGGVAGAHVRLAVGLSVGLTLLVLLNQWQAGNPG